MVRMRWLALALVCCLATTVHAQTTQDTGKAKPAMTHKVSSHKTSAHKTGAKTSTAHSSTTAATTGSTTEDKGKGTAKPGTKPVKHHARKASKPKAKPDSSTKTKG
ncbi:MAG: hypothetical protein ACREN3_01530 [Gemmatimonadaceae bacterium]